MNALGQTLVLYLLVGAGVAAAVYLRIDSIGRWQLLFRLGTATAFWPLYLPLVLSRAAPGGPALSADASNDPGDDLSLAIARTEHEIDAALDSLQGWADDVLASEGHRIRRLRIAWLEQAERIREMDRLLALPEELPSVAKDGIVEPNLVGELRVPEWSERLRQVQEVRRRHRDQLRSLRQRASEELMGALICVREIASMIQLARFTHTTPEGAAELLARIAG